MAVAFDEKTKALLDGTNFGTVATLNPDGSPQTSVVWLDRDEDAVVFSVTDDKRKTRNLRRDPRVSLSVLDMADPYFSVSIRGRAELVPDPDKRLSRRLSQKYLGTDPPDDAEGRQRFVVRIVADHVAIFGG